MKFAVYASNDGLKWAAEKLKKGAASPTLYGLNLIDTVAATSKVLAISRVKKSGAVPLSTHAGKNEPILAQSEEAKKVIYCDFNGVLDHWQKSIDCRENNDLFRLRNTVNIDNLYKLAKLAIDTGATVVLTSLWRNYGISFADIFRFLKRHPDPKVQAFYKEHQDFFFYECSEVTGDLGQRTDEVALHVKENNVTHCIVFEDDHHIDSRLNPIRTQSTVGLLDEHFEKAYTLLS